MQRREFLGVLAMAMAAPFLPTSPAPLTVSYVGVDLATRADRTVWVQLPRTYGYVDVENCQRVCGRSSLDAHVFFNGVDVTSRDRPHGTVLACDDRRGYIEVLSRNASGQHYADGAGSLARERQYGRVVLTFATEKGQA